jgi:S1-C subfamily serine protease
MGHHRRLISALVVIAALAALFWLGTGKASAEFGLFRSVPLSAGYNEVVYSGPTVPPPMIAGQVPGLRSILVWDAEAQEFESYIVDSPDFGRGLSVVRTGDVVWMNVAGKTTWDFPESDLPTEVSLSPGWNRVTWSGAADVLARDALAPLRTRLHSAFAWNAATGQYDVFSPTLPTLSNSLVTLQPVSAIWIRLNGDSVVTWQQSADGVSGGLVAAAEVGVPVARNSQEVERAIVHVQTTARGGAGFLVGDREILTSAHIVETFSRVTLHYPDGSRGIGVVGAIDRTLDIAVVVVDSVPANSTKLAWDLSASPQLTMAVWAWGYPFESSVIGAGFSPSVSVTGGIISAVRVRGDVSFIQTDAAVNPGNSGGALTTLDGRAIGLMTTVFTVNGQDAEGLNFAVNLVEHRATIRALLAEAGS